jgi:uncharacterized protein (TIGR03086 family)
MQPLDALTLASSSFESVLDQVGPDRLAAATPCEDWDVAALVGHVFLGNEVAVALLDGASQAEALAILDTEHPGDLIVQCRSSLADQLARMRAVTDWDAVVHHVIGDVPASQLLGFRIADLTLHGWDLATAIGVDARIPGDLAALVYENMLPMAPFIGSIGMFGEGPSGSLGEDADVQQRLLDLSGRRG